MLPRRHLRFAAVRLLAAFAILAACAGPAAADMYEDFIFAVTNDRVALVRELLAKGIDPNTVGPNGEPVLVMAARAGYTGTVDALLAGRADVKLRSKFGDSAIMAAALSGHLELVKKLRAKGADIDGAGWTPLIYAATGGHDAVVTYLLTEGANVNAESPNGTSALMMAVREGKGSTVTLLIARGANVNQRNQNGATALTWAQRGNEQNIAAALKRAGANSGGARLRSRRRAIGGGRHCLRQIERRSRHDGIGERRRDDARDQRRQHAHEAPRAVEMLLPVGLRQHGDFHFAAARRCVDETVVAKIDADV